MSITVLQALLITLFCIISNLMFPLLGDIGGYFGLGRPLIAGTITGLILGDVKCPFRRLPDILRSPA